MAGTDMSNLDDAGLVARLMDTRRDLVQTRFMHSMNRLENTASVRNVRRDIARIETELRRRELAQGLAKRALETLHGSAAAPVAAEEAASGGFLQSVVDKLAD